MSSSLGPPEAAPPAIAVAQHARVGLLLAHHAQALEALVERLAAHLGGTVGSPARRGCPASSAPRECSSCVAARGTRRRAGRPRPRADDRVPSATDDDRRQVAGADDHRAGRPRDRARGRRPSSASSGARTRTSRLSRSTTVAGGCPRARTRAARTDRAITTAARTPRPETSPITSATPTPELQDVVPAPAHARIVRRRAVAGPQGRGRAGRGGRAGSRLRCNAPSAAERSSRLSRAWLPASAVRSATSWSSSTSSG